MPERTMVNLLFDIVVESFGSYQTIRCFGCLQFVNSFDTATEMYSYVLLSLEGCITGLISVGYLHFFVVWVCWVGYLACFFIVLGLSCFLELF